ncbi:MAG: ATP-binding protein [Nocardioidaceae bacterium]
MTASLPLRLRVAMAFAVTTALALSGLGVFVYYRVQATLVDQARASLETQLDALAQVPRAGRVEATAQMTGESFGQVLTLDAVPIASSPHVRGTLLTPDEIPRDEGEDVTAEGPVRLADEDETERALLLLRRERDQVLVVGTSREDLEDALAGVLTQLLIGGPLALVLASWLGYLVAGAALRPVERMRQHAANISARSSGERLPLPPSRDELHALGLTLNAMLDRLEGALERERRFVAEASHELRTPLALLRMELDLALSRPRSAEEMQAALQSANEEVTRLTRLAEDLLLLADSDERRLLLDESSFDVENLLLAVAERFSTRAASEDRRVTVAGTFPLVVRADRARLDQALSNVVDNALRHGAGDVEVRADVRDGAVCLLVSDHGPGLADRLAERALDPFGRDSVGRSSGGRGLGLAIVRAVVTAHGGTVAVRTRPDPPGAEVRIELPGRRVA